jgi:hypothetical protein
MHEKVWILARWKINFWCWPVVVGAAGGSVIAGRQVLAGN